MPNNYFSLHTAFLGSSFFSLRVAVVMIACLDGDTLQNTKNGNLKSCLNCHVVEHTGDILGNKYGKDKSDNVERDSEKKQIWPQQNAPVKVIIQVTKNMLYS